MFVLYMLFEQTKQLFSKWLFCGIGTMFSLALLSVMVAIALTMVLAVSAAFWVGRFTGASTEGINNMALQQGGLGLILTALIVTASSMAAAFFEGMLDALTPSTASAATVAHALRVRGVGMEAAAIRRDMVGIPGGACSGSGVQGWRSGGPSLHGASPSTHDVGFSQHAVSGRGFKSSEA